MCIVPSQYNERCSRAITTPIKSIPDHYGWMRFWHSHNDTALFILQIFIYLHAKFKVRLACRVCTLSGSLYRQPPKGEKIHTIFTSIQWCTIILENIFFHLSHCLVFRIPVDTPILISKPVKNSLESNIGSLQQAYTYWVIDPCIDNSVKFSILNIT